MLTHKTPLHDLHVQQGATMVDFAGWLMPIHYGSQIAEHHAVRNHVGVFDVSHMGVVDFHGEKVIAYFRYLLANDVAKLQNGDALYTCMLNEQGGVIDDLIVYRINAHEFRAVINAGCRDKDIAWMEKHAADFPAEVAEKISHLKPFQADTLANTFFSRTGYTGEPGVEMILPVEKALVLWAQLMTLGVQPCGLGARDTLRLEAGYNLYGSDMTEKTSPLIANLSWTVSFKDEHRDFIGKKTLLAEKATGIAQKLVGLVLEDKGVLRSHQRVKIDGVGEGEITSGTFSPTLNKSIALARIPMCDAIEGWVERRKEWLKVKIVKPRFIS